MAMGYGVKWMIDGALKHKRALGLSDELLFGVLLIERHLDYHFFPYHLLELSTGNHPGLLRLACGGHVALLRGKNLFPIAVALQQHRLAWVMEGDAASGLDGADTYIEELRVVPAKRNRTPEGNSPRCGEQYLKS